jgi:hypothetical protein
MGVPLRPTKVLERSHASCLRPTVNRLVGQLWIDLLFAGTGLVVGTVGDLSRFTLMN